MKWFNYLTLGVAVVISACAAYYSIVGLTAIFSAAFWSIVIMGSSLELAKLTSAVWLHLNWHHAKWWIKLYMTPAVAVLMLITSMGIFGFLSKAHIEQVATTSEATAQIDRIEDELSRFEQIQTKAQQRIRELESGSSGADSALQAQIDREQARIDSAYSRVQPAIDEQNQIISRIDEQLAEITKPQTQELQKIQDAISAFESAMSSNDIKSAQLILIQNGYLQGRADGKLGRQTSSAIQEFRNKTAARKVELEKSIQQARAGEEPKIRAARDEIARIRSTVESQVAQSNELITKLSAQLGQRSGGEIEGLIKEQTDRYEDARQQIDTLISQKFELEKEVRKLEAEVGPIKYVAELIFGEADKTLLEKAVQWMTLLLVLVFDPLAVIMILAATGGLVDHRANISLIPVESTQKKNTVKTRKSRSSKSLNK